MTHKPSTRLKSARPSRSPQKPSSERQYIGSRPDLPQPTTNRNQTVSFPPAWTWLSDEIIPAYVKQAYSPRESWKDKPFSKVDASFFFRGIEELSTLFTEERPSQMPAYFAHPKFRSAYLLYFLPLQASKFITLFNLHPKAIEAALAHGLKTGVMNVADLGAGPGTASLALLLWLLSDRPEFKGVDLPKIEFHWLDTQKTIMEDGKALVEQLAEQFPKLRGKVSVKVHVAPWWKATALLPTENSLILMGHVLNETSLGSAQSSKSWPELLSLAQGGGILMVEPATRRNAQFLSQIRDQFIEGGLIEAEPTSIWGPCLHAGRCPLAEGRDWCHFSVPVRIPGQWFSKFSEGIGSERQFAKFSYLWFASNENRAPKPAANLRRVVSDPLRADRTSKAPATVLLCEPEEASRMSVKPPKLLWRGDVVKVDSTR